MAYIDRSELNAKIEEEVYLTKSAKSAFQRIVYNTPSADVAPVRHGRWVRYRTGSDAQCTRCNWSTDFDIPLNYCPNCGAKMDGGDNA